MIAKHLHPLLESSAKEINEQKLQIIRIFLSPRGITVKNCSIVPKIELERFSYDKSVYQISIQYVQPLRR